MGQFSLLRIAVAAAAGYAIVALLVLLVKAKSLGIKPTFARPSGSGARGISYAFFRGMLPWEKESVAKHVPTFVAGLLYHAGILAAFMFLVFSLVPITLPDAVVSTVQIVVSIGFACGLGLLIKRYTLVKMRVISTVDDAVSNLLVDLFLIAALVASLSLRFQSVFFLTAVALFIYLPLGKIRHCVFFFCTRIIFGMYFGRRGVLPPAYGEKGAK